MADRFIKFHLLTALLCLAGFQPSYAIMGLLSEEGDSLVCEPQGPSEGAEKQVNEVLRVAERELPASGVDSAHAALFRFFNQKMTGAAPLEDDPQLEQLLETYGESDLMAAMELVSYYEGWLEPRYQEKQDLEASDFEGFQLKEDPSLMAALELPSEWAERSLREVMFEDILPDPVRREKLLEISQVDYAEYGDNLLNQVIGSDAAAALNPGEEGSDELVGFDFWSTYYSEANQNHAVLGVDKPSLRQIREFNILMDRVRFLYLSREQVLPALQKEIRKAYGESEVEGLNFRKLSGIVGRHYSQTADFDSDQPEALNSSFLGVSPWQEVVIQIEIRTPVHPEDPINWGGLLSRFIKPESVEVTRFDNEGEEKMRALLLEMLVATEGQEAYLPGESESERRNRLKKEYLESHPEAAAQQRAHDNWSPPPRRAHSYSMDMLGGRSISAGSTPSGSYSRPRAPSIPFTRRFHEMIESQSVSIAEGSPKGMRARNKIKKLSGNALVQLALIRQSIPGFSALSESGELLPQERIQEVATEILEYEQILSEFTETRPKLKFSSVENFQKHKIDIINSLEGIEDIAPGYSVEELGLGNPENYIVGFTDEGRRKFYFTDLYPNLGLRKEDQKLSMPEFKSADEFVSALGSLKEALEERRLNLIEQTLEERRAAVEDLTAEIEEGIEARRLAALEDAETDEDREAIERQARLERAVAERLKDKVQERDLESWTLARLESLDYLSKEFGWDQVFLRGSSGFRSLGLLGWLDPEGEAATNPVNDQAHLHLMATATALSKAQGVLEGFQEDIPQTEEGKPEALEILHLLPRRLELVREVVEYQRWASEFYGSAAGTNIFAIPPVRWTQQRRLDLFRKLVREGVIDLDLTDPEVQKALSDENNPGGFFRTGPWVEEKDRTIPASATEQFDYILEQAAKVVWRRIELDQVQSGLISPEYFLKSNEYSAKMRSEEMTSYYPPRQVLMNRRDESKQYAARFETADEIRQEPERYQNKRIQDPTRPRPEYTHHEKARIASSTQTAAGLGGELFAARTLSMDAIINNIFTGNKADRKIAEWFVGLKSPSSLDAAEGKVPILTEHTLRFAGYRVDAGLHEILQREGLEVLLELLNEYSEYFMTSGQKLYYITQRDYGENRGLRSGDLQEIMQRVREDDDFAKKVITTDTYKTDFFEQMSFSEAKAIMKSAGLWSRWNESSRSEKSQIREELLHLRKFINSTYALFLGLDGLPLLERLGRIQARRIVEDLFYANAEYFELDQGGIPRFSELVAEEAEKRADSLKYLLATPRGETEALWAKRSQEEQELEGETLAEAFIRAEENELGSTTKVLRQVRKVLEMSGSIAAARSSDNRTLDSPAGFVVVLINGSKEDAAKKKFNTVLAELDQAIEKAGIGDNLQIQRMRKWLENNNFKSNRSLPEDQWARLLEESTEPIFEGAQRDLIDQLLLEEPRPSLVVQYNLMYMRNLLAHTEAEIDFEGLSQELGEFADKNLMDVDELFAGLSAIAQTRFGQVVGEEGLQAAEFDNQIENARTGLYELIPPNFEKRDELIKLIDTFSDKSTYETLTEVPPGPEAMGPPAPEVMGPPEKQSQPGPMTEGEMGPPAPIEMEGQELDLGALAVEMRLGGFYQMMQQAFVPVQEVSEQVEESRTEMLKELGMLTSSRHVDIWFKDVDGLYYPGLYSKAKASDGFGFDSGGVEGLMDLLWAQQDSRLLEVEDSSLRQKSIERELFGARPEAYLEGPGQGSGFAWKARLLSDQSAKLAKSISASEESLSRQELLLLWKAAKEKIEANRGLAPEFEEKQQAVFSQFEAGLIDEQEAGEQLEAIQKEFEEKRTPVLLLRESTDFSNLELVKNLFNEAGIQWKESFDSKKLATQLGLLRSTLSLSNELVEINKQIALQISGQTQAEELSEMWYPQIKEFADLAKLYNYEPSDLMGGYEEWAAQPLEGWKIMDQVQYEQIRRTKNPLSRITHMVTAGASNALHFAGGTVREIFIEPFYQLGEAALLTGVNIHDEVTRGAAGEEGGDWMTAHYRFLGHASRELLGIVGDEEAVRQSVVNYRYDHGVDEAFQRYTEQLGAWEGDFDGRGKQLEWYDPRTLSGFSEELVDDSTNYWVNWGFNSLVVAGGVRGAWSSSRGLRHIKDIPEDQLVRMALDRRGVVQKSVEGIAGRIRRAPGIRQAGDVVEHYGNRALDARFRFYGRSRTPRVTTPSARDVLTKELSIMNRPFDRLVFSSQATLGQVARSGGVVRGLRNTFFTKEGRRGVRDLLGRFTFDAAVLSAPMFLVQMNIMPESLGATSEDKWWSAGSMVGETLVLLFLLNRSHGAFRWLAQRYPKTAFLETRVSPAFMAYIWKMGGESVTRYAGSEYAIGIGAPRPWSDLEKDKKGKPIGMSDSMEEDWNEHRQITAEALGQTFLMATLGTAPRWGKLGNVPGVRDTGFAKVWKRWYPVLDEMPQMTMRQFSDGVRVMAAREGAEAVRNYRTKALEKNDSGKSLFIRNYERMSSTKLHPEKNRFEIERMEREFDSAIERALLDNFERQRELTRIADLTGGAEVNIQELLEVLPSAVERYRRKEALEAQDGAPKTSERSIISRPRAEERPEDKLWWDTDPVKFWEYLEEYGFADIMSTREATHTMQEIVRRLERVEEGQSTGDKIGDVNVLSRFGSAREAQELATLLAVSAKYRPTRRPGEEDGNYNPQWAGLKPQDWQNLNKFAHERRVSAAYESGWKYTETDPEEREVFDSRLEEDGTLEFTLGQTRRIVSERGEGLRTAEEGAFKFGRGEVLGVERVIPGSEGVAPRKILDLDHIGARFNFDANRVDATVLSDGSVYFRLAKDREVLINLGKEGEIQVGFLDRGGIQQVTSPRELETILREFDPSFEVRDYEGSSIYERGALVRVGEQQDSSVTTWFSDGLYSRHSLDRPARFKGDRVGRYTHRLYEGGKESGYRIWEVVDPAGRISLRFQQRSSEGEWSSPRSLRLPAFNEGRHYMIEPSTGLVTIVGKNGIVTRIDAKTQTFQKDIGGKPIAEGTLEEVISFNQRYLREQTNPSDISAGNIRRGFSGLEEFVPRESHLPERQYEWDQKFLHNFASLRENVREVISSENWSSTIKRVEDFNENTYRHRKRILDKRYSKLRSQIEKRPETAEREQALESLREEYEVLTDNFVPSARHLDPEIREILGNQNWGFSSNSSVERFLHRSPRQRDEALQKRFEELRRRYDPDYYRNPAADSIWRQIESEYQQIRDSFLMDG